MKVYKKITFNFLSLKFKYELKKEENIRNTKRKDHSVIRFFLETIKFLMTNMKKDDLLLINIIIGYVILLISK